MSKRLVDRCTMASVCMIIVFEKDYLRKVVSDTYLGVIHLYDIFHFQMEYFPVKTRVMCIYILDLQLTVNVGING